MDTPLYPRLAASERWLMYISAPATMMNAVTDPITINTMPMNHLQPLLELLRLELVVDVSVGVGESGVVPVYE